MTLYSATVELVIREHSEKNPQIVTDKKTLQVGDEGRNLETLLAELSAKTQDFQVRLLTKLKAEES